MARLAILLASVLLAGGFAGCGKAAPAPAGLTLERTIALPKVAGRIDHLAIDLKRRRLYVAELGDGTVEGIDPLTARARRRP